MGSYEPAARSILVVKGSVYGQTEDRNFHSYTCRRLWVLAVSKVAMAGSSVIGTVGGATLSTVHESDHRGVPSNYKYTAAHK